METAAADVHQLLPATSLRGGGRNRTAVRGFAGANTWFAMVRSSAYVQFRERVSSDRFAPVRGMPQYLRGIKLCHSFPGDLRQHVFWRFQDGSAGA